MESDQIVAIEIEAVAWDRRASTALDQVRLEVPDHVGMQGLQAYLERRFGPSTGTVNTVDETGSDVVVGWLFAAEALAELGLDHPDANLLAVPFVRFADGTRRELTVYNAELQQRFEQIARALDPGLESTERARPDERADLLDLGGSPAEQLGRLEDEQLTLYHADRAGVSLELGGWLRRMLAEGHTFLVVEIADTGRYLQFVTHDGTWLRGEVVGPTHLLGRPPFTGAELLTIAALGWFEPDDGPGGGNFWREWGDPETGEDVDVDEAAEIGAMTLCDAFGPFEPQDIEILTGSSRPGELH